MVLSNKRLKQKLRAAKAELVVVPEAGNKDDKISESSLVLDSQISQSLRTILNPIAQKPKLSKREKLRTKPNSEIVVNEEMSDAAKEKEENGSKSDVGVVEKKKKRKRDESEASENVVEKKLQQLKKKKKNKKKKKTKKKVGDGLVKEEMVEQNGSGATAGQLVAKTDEIIDRKPVEISSRVYVGGIPYYSTEDDIRSFFESCGTITSIDCMTFPDTGKFRGIAMITFKTEAAAKRALALDGSDMGGLFLKIQPFQSARVNKSSNFSPSVMAGYNRIYIGNLSWDVTEDDLKKLFADCTVSSIRFGKDKESEEFKGYAHVDFADSPSLSIALKLDQTIVCGRPVKISCAVPKKANATALKPMPKSDQINPSIVAAADEHQDTSSGAHAVGTKIQRRSCYECGEYGHLSASCPSKNVDDSANLEAANENQVTNTEENGLGSKLRRRSCYECGERGHLSSSCPNKQADVSLSIPDKQADFSSSLPKKQSDDFKNQEAFNESQFISTEANALSSKIRRRSCYECGEKGHLSSACPNKQAEVSLSIPEKQADLSPSWPKKQAYDYTEKAIHENQVNSTEEIALSSKIRRRSCYECGEKGHLSSSCPKKPTDLSSSLPEKKADISSSLLEKQADLSSSWPKKQADFSDYSNPGAANETSGGASAVSSKIRRRTCYECGERGHLPSACPKAQS